LLKCVTIVEFMVTSPIILVEQLKLVGWWPRVYL
jgi:hypothetical protein